MEKKFIMGIDVSKDKLDVCLVRTGSVEAAEEKVLKNSRTELEKYFKRTARKYGKEELLVCLEHTGYYGLLLCTVLQQSGIDYAVVPALEIKRAQGICRGKTDRVDAGRIAVYGWRYADRIRLTKLPGRELLLIKELSACRELYVKISVQLKNALKAHKDAGKAFENETVLSGISRQLKNIEEETAVCDEKIQKLVESIPGLNSNFHLLNTVSGIGPVTAAALILATQNFTVIKEARKFNSYAGTAPFMEESGKTCRGSRVNSLANKKIKTLLHNGACSAICHDNEIKAYYKRKTAEGKAKMSVINAVACKLVYRAFAVINRQTPYVNLYQNNLHMS